MNEIIIFTTFEFGIFLMFAIMLGFIAVVSSFGWYYESRRKDKQRKAIKDCFSVEYNLAKFGGTANYKDYMADLEKSIRKGKS